MNEKEIKYLKQIMSQSAKYCGEISNYREKEFEKCLKKKNKKYK
ncbi:MAG: hypothetical protein ACI4UU_00635 [Clostridia bacterium]